MCETTGCWPSLHACMCKCICAESRIQNPESNARRRIQNPESRIQNPESRIQNPESNVRRPRCDVEHLHSAFCILHSAFLLQNPEFCAHACANAYAQNPESRIQNPTSGAESRIQNPESRIQNPTSSARDDVEHIESAFCILHSAFLLQNPVFMPGRPTSSIHAFWGILDAGAESSIHAGPSNIQYPRLWVDSGRWGRIQNPEKQFLYPLTQPLLTLMTNGFVR